MRHCVCHCSWTPGKSSGSLQTGKMGQVRDTTSEDNLWAKR